MSAYIQTRIGLLRLIDELMDAEATRIQEQGRVRKRKMIKRTLF
jgi:hypothetical protein